MLKKILLMVLSFTMAFSLFACSGNSTMSSGGSSGGDTNGNLKLQIQNCTPLVDYAGNTPIDQVDTITFGFDSNSEPIEWIVLEKEANKALLLSKYLLTEHTYNDESKDVTWDTCTLRDWLNNEFMGQIFSKKEQNSILTIDVINNDNEQYGTKGGSNTKDKMFLLSIDEFKKYFSNGGEKAIAHYKNSSVDYWWWLRSPGDSQSSAIRVHYFGYLDENGPNVRGDYGVRPALWVKY